VKLKNLLLVNTGKEVNKMKLPEPKSTGAGLLKGSDLEDTVTVTTIEEVRLSDQLRNQFIEIEGKMYTPVLTLKYNYAGKEEFVDLALNKTNYQTLLKAFGDDSDNWLGKEIRLIKIKQRNPNTRQIVDAIAVEPVLEQVPEQKKKKK
jgi:hypothetical protein